MALPAVTAILGAIPWKGIGKFLLGNWKWIALGLLALSWHLRGERIEELERQAKGWDNAVQTLEANIEKNTAAITECEQINKDNASEIGRLKSDNRVLEANVAAGNRNTETVIEGYRNEANAIRGIDTGCRTLDDDLPESFVGGLRKPTTAVPD